MGGVGVAGAVLLMAHRVYLDDRLTWVVIGGCLLCLVLWLIGIDFRRFREAMEARATALRLQIEADLIAMRAMALTKGMTGQAAPDASNYLAAMLSGVPTPDVVDQPGPTWEENGRAFGE